MLFETCLNTWTATRKAQVKEMGIVNYFKLYINLVLARRKSSEEGKCEILSSCSQMVECLASQAIGREVSET